MRSIKPVPAAQRVPFFTGVGKAAQGVGSAAAVVAARRAGTACVASV